MTTTLPSGSTFPLEASGIQSSTVPPGRPANPSTTTLPPVNAFPENNASTRRASPRRETSSRVTGSRLTTPTSRATTLSRLTRPAVTFRPGGPISTSLPDRTTLPFSRDTTSVSGVQDRTSGSQDATSVSSVQDSTSGVQDSTTSANVLTSSIQSIANVITQRKGRSQPVTRPGIVNVPTQGLPQPPSTNVRRPTLHPMGSRSSGVPEFVTPTLETISSKFTSRLPFHRVTRRGKLWRFYSQLILHRCFTTE